MSTGVIPVKCLVLFASGVRGLAREFHLQIRDLPRPKSEMGVKLQHM